MNIEDIDMTKAHKLFDINVFGTINGTRAVAPHFKQAGHGLLINISSTTAFEGGNTSSASIYAASKYALRGFTNEMRRELAASGVTVIGVYPGGMKTELFHEQIPANIDSFMSPEEVAQRIVDNAVSASPEMEQVLARPGQVLKLV